MEQGTGLLKKELLVSKIWGYGGMVESVYTADSKSVLRHTSSNLVTPTICGCSIKEVYQFSKLMVRYRNSSSAPRGCLALSQKETI